MAYDRDAILTRVYDGMCEGRSVDDICTDAGMPAASTVYRWLVDSEKCEEYTRAKAVRAERLAHKVIVTAEDEDMKADDKRVRIDAYKWAAGKLSGKYSEKVKHVGGGPEDDPIQHEHDVTQEAADAFTRSIAGLSARE